MVTIGRVMAVAVAAVMTVFVCRRVVHVVRAETIVRRLRKSGRF